MTPRPAGSWASCHDCSLVMDWTDSCEPAGLECPRCGATVHRRKRDSIARSWAYLAAALVLYIPANVYPMLTVTSLGWIQSDTIFSGVIYLFVTGMWPLGLIVFVASVLVPLIKIFVLGGLLVSLGRRSPWRPRDRTVVYRAVETIGRWSMVDIYVVMILVALVQMGAIATVRAEIGAWFFGAVVFLTILAAESFDPRLIWDRAEEPSG